MTIAPDVSHGNKINNLIPSPEGASCNSLWQRHRKRDSSLLMKPCKGEILYVALTGLVMIMLIVDLGRCPRLSNYRPFGAFSNSF
jgi:hypothetical protein